MPSWPSTPPPRLEPIAIKGLLSSLLLPPIAPLLLALVGLLLAWRGRRGGIAVAAVGVAAAWLLATPAVAHALLHLLERDLVALTPERWAAAAAAPRPPQAIVVLGGGSRSDSREHPDAEHVHDRALKRVLHGARIARMTGLPVLLSGGMPRKRQASEAELMRRVLEGDLGVRARWLEERSRDTADNASESAAMLQADGIDSVVLVTQAYHMRRAQAAFEKAGLKVLAAPHHFAGKPAEEGWGDHWKDWLPGPEAAADAYLALHELLGLWWYRLRRFA